jgi:hypothetical protein
MGSTPIRIEYNLTYNSKEYVMDDQVKELFGAVITAIGTILSAIASIPTQSTRITDLYKGLDIVGNTLQGTGNAIQADAQRNPSLEKLGNEIQAIGNSTVVAGLILDVEEVTEEKLVITGNLLQALGGGVALGEEFEDPSAPGQIYNIYGNLLQSTGNSLQAIGGSINLREKEESESESESDSDSPGDVIIFTGSWIQAIGSVISILGTLPEESKRGVPSP